MKLFLIAIVCLLPIAGFAREDGIDALIQLKPVVEVDGTSEHITFADLINAHGLDDSQLKELRAVRLADSPKAGESRSFTALALEETLRPLVKTIESQIGEKVSVRVPMRVTVTRKIFHLTKEAVEDELRKEFRALCEDCGILIDKLRIPVLNGSAANLSWKLRIRPELPKGGFSIPLEVKSDGQERTYWVSGQLTVDRLVPVLKRAVQIGEKLRSEDFEMEKRDVTFALDASPTKAEIELSIVSRQLAAGQILYRNSLKREMAVKLGEVVKVITGGESKGATWQISIEGVAQGSAYLGDVVKVKIPKTQKLVSGLLREKGLVEVR